MTQPRQVAVSLAAVRAGGIGGEGMSCRPDSSGADWFVCPRGTAGCPRCHDGMTPYCRDCATGSCTWGHEPLPASVPIEEWCERHPEQRQHLMGSGFSLKAACENCGRYGTVDDGSLVCANCGERHAITPEQRRQRDVDIAL